MSIPMIFELILDLLNKLGIIVLIAFFISRSKNIKSFILKDKMSMKQQIIIAIFFGILGIIGTYSGIPINDAIANSRSIGVIVAGIFGGPLAGIIAGLIAGIHRALIPIGRFTAIACGISTVIGGIIAGYSRQIFISSKNKWLVGVVLTIFIEGIQMLIILLISRPFPRALELVQIIFLPMAFINSFGTGFFILLIEQIQVENDLRASKKTSLALNVARKTLPILRNGLNKDSAEEAAMIIYDICDVSAVSFTNRDTILAHIGIGSDHHTHSSNIHTDITKKAIFSGNYIVANDKNEIECDHDNCTLQSVIVVPLFMKDDVIGTIKLYKDQPNSINTNDIEFARGLGQLFSTQLELSQIDFLKQLRCSAEIKALQAQIHPHFLFNALNTIISFCRTDANKARELLTKLSQYLRTSFQNTEAFIPIQQEIINIRNYLDIEEVRFSHRLQIKYDIEENVNCDVPPLLLQPIVENSLIHGLKDVQENGLLEIVVKSVANGTFISITDNGCGMSEEKVKSLYNDSKEENGIGVKNVINRLYEIYNTELSINSEINKGTTMSFIIPSIQAR